MLNKKREIVTDTVILASIPIFAYILKFIFDSGYYRFYGVPNEINSFSVGSVLSTIWLAGGLLLTFIFYMSVLLPATEKSKDVVMVTIENIILLLTFVFIFLLLFNGPSALTRTFIVLLVLILTRIFIIPLLRKDKSLDYIDRVKSEIRLVSSRKKESPLDYIYSFYIYRISTFIILLIGTMCTVYNIGFTIAKNKNSYFINQNDKSWVAIKFVDNNVIFIQRDGVKITGKFQVIPLDENGLILKSEFIGKLHY